MSFTVSRRYFLQGLSAIAATLPFASLWPKTAIAAPKDTSPGEIILEQLLEDNFLTETEELVRITTYLGEGRKHPYLVQRHGQGSGGLCTPQLLESLLATAQLA